MTRLSHNLRGSGVLAVPRLPVHSKARSWGSIRIPATPLSIWKAMFRRRSPSERPHDLVEIARLLQGRLEGQPLHLGEAEPHLRGHQDYRSAAQLWIARISRSTSAPFMRGNAKSSRTRSGRCLRTCARPSAPSAAPGRRSLPTRGRSCTARAYPRGPRRPGRWGELASALYHSISVGPQLF